MVFNVSAANLINIFLIAAGIGVCGLCFLHISGARHLRKEVRRYFQIFFLLIVFYISAHLARQLMNGLSGDGVRTALYVVTFSEMIAAGFMAHMMSLLILAVTRPGKTAFRSFAIIFYAALIAHVLLLSVGQISTSVFFYDGSNFYHRANLYLLSNVGPVIMLAADTVLLIRYRGNITRLVKIGFWNYIIAPVVAILLQITSPDLQFIIFATVGASVLMFSVFVKDQNDKYERQQIETSRIETELTMASSIQADMLPNTYPAFPERREFDIYASMDPAKEVGGDFYDFFLIDDDHLCLVMADVSGKGVPAALFMMVARIILSNNAMTGKSPAEILTDTNAAICSNNREQMFVTVWLGILEISTGRLTAANAGHEYPVLMQPGGGFELFKDKHGFVIGAMEGIKYREYEVQLKPGSKLFLYTDGVPEATNAENELFGTDRMLRALNDSAGASLEEMLRYLRRAVDGFVNGAEQFDDLTMLGLEYKGDTQ